MSSHTLAPWKVEAIPDEARRDPDLAIHEEDKLWIVEDSEAGEVLATVYDTSKLGAEGNARLIAVAPDMYQVLAASAIYLTMTQGPCLEGCDCMLHAMNAVVAKADGRS